MKPTVTKIINTGNERNGLPRHRSWEGEFLNMAMASPNLLILICFFFFSFFLFFFSIVERERRKDSVSLLWPEPRSPSSDNANTPNVHTPLKEGGSGNVFFSVPRQGSWDPGRFGEYSLYLFFSSFFFFSLGIAEANDVCINHRTPKLSHDCTYFLVGFIVVYSSFFFFFFFFSFFFSWKIPNVCTVASKYWFVYVYRIINAIYESSENLDAEGVNSKVECFVFAHWKVYFFLILSEGSTDCLKIVWTRLFSEVLSRLKRSNYGFKSLKVQIRGK